MSERAQLQEAARLIDLAKQMVIHCEQNDPEMLAFTRQVLAECEMTYLALENNILLYVALDLGWDPTEDPVFCGEDETMEWELEEEFSVEAQQEYAALTQRIGFSA